jgi:hypothetical protein
MGGKLSFQRSIKNKLFFQQVGRVARLGHLTLQSKNDSILSRCIWQGPCVNTEVPCDAYKKKRTLHSLSHLFEKSYTPFVPKRVLPQAGFN